MMKKLLFVFLFIPFLGFTQNYEYIKTDGTYFFGTNFAYRIDSIIESDTGQLLYSYRRIYTIINDYEGYVDPYTSWLGDQVLIDEEGRTKFYSWTNQPFTFYSDYEPEVEWEIFKYQNGNTIRGQFIGEAEWMDIFPDFADSVKTISLQMYNSNGEPVNHAYNDYEIRLSKNYGMLDALYYVAIDQFETITSSLKSIYGIKLADTVIGQNYYYEEAISSLEINSQMHFISYFNKEDQFPHYVNRTVVGKQLSENYCTYTYLDSILYLGEVSTITHEEKWYISALPFESMFRNDSLDKRGYMYTGGWHIGDKWDHNTYFYYHFWHGNNTTIFGQPAWYVDYWELNMGNQFNHQFIKNVGRLTVGKGNDWQGDELVYYKNSQEEWGEPLVIDPYTWNGEYKVMNPDFTIYFKKGPLWSTNRDIRAIRVDSTVVMTDTLKRKYYSYRTAEPFYFNDDKFLNPNTSWIGDYAIENDSGITIFVNQYKDEFIISPRTIWGPFSWIFHEFDDGGYIVAKVSFEYSGEIIPGLNDTFRYLSFEAKDSTGNFINHGINSAVLRWSKNYGLLDYIDFSQFPEIETYYFIGMENDTISYGWTNPIDEILMSLQTGDESHIEFVDSLGHQNQVKRQVVHKETDENRVSYVIDQCRQIDSDTALISFEKDTLVFALNTLPRQSIFDPEITGYKHSMGLGYFDTLDICSEKTFFEFYRSNAIEDVQIGDMLLWRTDSDAHFEYQANQRFISNIGLSSEVKFSDQDGDTLYFFKTDSEMCGTAFEYLCETGIAEYQLSDFIISPNPSNGMINLSSSENIEELIVYNLNGQIVWQADKLEGDKIDLTELENGIYLMSLQTKSQNIIYQKVIINK